MGAWVYKNLDSLGGVSFLPHSDHIYPQAPYQDITEKEFLQWEAAFPQIDWGKFDSYEKDDSQMNMHEFACVNGACEIV